MEILDQPQANEAITAQASRVIRRQVQHLTRLVDDLLDVSRITAGKIELQFERVDLVGVVRDAVDTHRPLLDLRQHNVSFRHTPKHVVVDGDLVRITQVVGNLVHNAAKYTPDGGRIDMAVEEDGVYATLRVTDSGVGIASDVLPRVFDVFAQAERSLDRAQGGLGLGLALVRQLVELHGGTVEALSEGLHQGSEFVVRLPLAAAQRTEDGLESVPCREGQASSRQRVLVVDDNQDAAAMLSELLAMTGCCVETAHDGSARCLPTSHFTRKLSCWISACRFSTVIKLPGTFATHMPVEISCSSR